MEHTHMLKKVAVMAWTIITIKTTNTHILKKAFMAITMKTTSEDWRVNRNGELRMAAIYAPALSASVFS